MLAHRLKAAIVVVTDGDTDTLKNLRANVSRNCFKDTTNVDDPIHNICCEQLVWGNETQIQSLQRRTGRFDVILGSDIIYLEEILDPLWQTIDQLLEPVNGKFLLSYARRNVAFDLVLDKATKHGYGLCVPSAACEGIFIFRKLK